MPWSTGVLPVLEIAKPVCDVALCRTEAAVRWDGGTTKPLLRQHLTTAWFSGSTIVT